MIVTELFEYFGRYEYVSFIIKEGEAYRYTPMRTVEEWMNLDSELIHYLVLNPAQAPIEPLGDGWDNWFKGGTLRSILISSPMEMYSDRYLDKLDARIKTYLEDNQRLWRISGRDLPTIEIRAFNFDDALEKARQLNPNYTGGSIVR